jgi:hypothetical protein
MAHEQRFRSGIGWCFGASVLAVCAALGLSQVRGFNPVSLVVLGLALALMLWMSASTAYLVSDAGMLVRSGPMRRWVDAKLVERVRPVRTVLAAPALSLDRLEVSGEFGAVVVSPEDREGFVRALKRVAPQLRLEGGLEALDAGEPAQPRQGVAAEAGLDRILPPSRRGQDDGP